MTKFVLTVMTVIPVLAFALPAQTATVKSAPAQVSIARVTQVVPLVTKQGLQVSVSVQDLGGSTDVSPTQAVYLTLYAKGEMFSTEATFKVADVINFKSAKRVSGGVYQVVADTYDTVGSNGMAVTTYTIDAVKAVNAIQAVNCGGDFDCDASSKFATDVDVTATAAPLR